MANGPVLVVDFGASTPSSSPAACAKQACTPSWSLIPCRSTRSWPRIRRRLFCLAARPPCSSPRATIDTKVFESGVPVLGICYGFQVMAYELGGKVDKAALGEYGKTSATIDDAPASSPTPPPSRPRG